MKASQRARRPGTPAHTQLRVYHRGGAIEHSDMKASQRARRPGIHTAQGLL
jgi:hypothetical protein